MTEAIDRVERYQALKATLEARRAEILEKLRSLREGGTSPLGVVTDTEEQAVNDFVRDIDFALVEMAGESLKKIDEAMQRLEDGSYGLCRECEEEISRPRLKALPFADLCITCKEEEEKRLDEERDRAPHTVRLDAISTALATITSEGSE